MQTFLSTASRKWRRPEGGPDQSYNAGDRGKPRHRQELPKQDPVKPDQPPVEGRPDKPPNFDPESAPVFPLSDGHVAAQCPKKTCLMSVSCPNPHFIIYPGTTNGQREDNLIEDTACNKYQIHPWWIPKGFTNEGTVHIRGPNHSTTSYPTTTTTVLLEVEGESIQVRMEVNQNIGYDAIMGVYIPNLFALVSRSCSWKTRKAR